MTVLHSFPLFSHSRSKYKHKNPCINAHTRAHAHTVTHSHTRTQTAHTRLASHVCVHTNKVLHTRFSALMHLHLLYTFDCTRHTRTPHAHTTRIHAHTHAQTHTHTHTRTHTHNITMHNTDICAMSKVPKRDMGIKFSTSRSLAKQCEAMGNTDRSHRAVQYFESFASTTN